MKELDLKDGYENKEEISKLKSTNSQVINNSSNLKGVWNPRHLLGKVLGLHVFLGKDRYCWYDLMLQWFYLLIVK